jgi:hypothetical protein
VQPDGTIVFQPVHNDNSSLQLDFSQSITATGGTVYGTTSMQRFYDFDRKNELFNGVPYAIGYSQPLFQFNALRWDKKIEPLKFNESKQAYIESQEQIAYYGYRLLFRSAAGTGKLPDSPNQLYQYREDIDYCQSKIRPWEDL